jgi:preprotein translocase subunit SecE
VSKLMDGIRKVRFFLSDVRDELRKSTWPTRGELVESTVVVMLSCVLFALFVGACDLALGRLVGVLTP